MASADARDQVGDEDPDCDLDLSPRPIHPIHTAKQWPVPASSGMAGLPLIMSEPRASTPPDSEPETSVIPSGPLWSMNYLRHGLFASPASADGHEIRWATCVDDPGASMYAIDDGDRFCMVARDVGTGADGSSYQLVARVKRLDFEDVRAGWAEAGDRGQFAYSDLVIAKRITDSPNQGDPITWMPGTEVEPPSDGPGIGARRVNACGPVVTSVISVKRPDDGSEKVIVAG